MDILFSEIADLDSVVQQIIRPTRSRYTDRDLGLRGYNNMQVRYKEYSVANRFNLQLKTSLWESQQNTDQIVVYLHGNAGSRMESTALIQHLIPHNISLCSFDFSGCGQSDGDFITLGLKEVYDIEAIINFLVQFTKYRNITLVGRSMGAVTAVLYQGKFQNQYVKKIVLDSPFSSFNELSYEKAAEQANGFTSYFIDNALQVMQEKIIQEIGYDLFSLNIDKIIKKINIPIFFIYSTIDQMIKYTHSLKLIDAYESQGRNSEKMVIQQTHNQFRGDDYFKRIVNFIKGQAKTQFVQPIQNNYFFRQSQQIPQVLRQSFQPVQNFSQVQTKRSQSIQKIQKHLNATMQVQQNYFSVPQQIHLPKRF